MLVLSRQAGQEIIIGEDITVTVLEIRGDKIRIGLTAPENIPIHRSEVAAIILRENKAKSPETT